MRDNFDKILKEKLENYNSEPSPEVWNKLVKKIRPRSNRFGYLLIIPALAASILLLLFFRTPDSEISTSGTAAPFASEKVQPESKLNENQKSAPVPGPNKAGLKIENSFSSTGPAQYPETSAIAVNPGETEVASEETKSPVNTSEPLTQESEKSIEPSAYMANHPEEPVTEDKPSLFGQLLNAAANIIGINASWKEEKTGQGRKVKIEGDLGFVNFKKVKTYPNP